MQVRDVHVAFLGTGAITVSVSKSFETTIAKAGNDVIYDGSSEGFRHCRGSSKTSSLKWKGF